MESITVVPFMFGHNTTVELQWLEHLWNHKNMFQLMSVNHSARSGGIIRISFQFSSTPRYVVVLEAILMGTHNIPFQYKLENCVCKTQVMPPYPKPVLTPCLTLNTFNQYWRLMSEMSKSKLQ